MSAGLAAGSDGLGQLLDDVEPRARVLAARLHRDVHREPVEPGAERAAALEALQRAKDFDEDVLQHVFQIGAGNEKRELVGDVTVVQRVDFTKRRRVTRARPLEHVGTTLGNRDVRAHHRGS